MSQLIQLAYNAVNAKIITESREIKLLVSELLSYEVENAAQTTAFRSGSWDGRSSFFSFKSCTFPAGFVQRVDRELTAKGHRVQHVRHPLPQPLGPEIGTYDPFGYGFTERYDYQPGTIKALLQRGRMVARIATGGGKSFVAALAFSTLKRPTLFLTTRTALMHQMADAMVKVGTNVGVLGEGTWKPRRGFNVATVQTITARLKEDHADFAKTVKLLEMFEFVIGEEAHESGGNGYYDILNRCKNAHYRLALTATPFMRDSDESNMRLEAAFGPVGIQISEKLLIDRGILATPSFKLVQTPPPPLLRRGTPWPACYDIGVTENQERNKGIVFEAARGAKHGVPTLILVKRKTHGETLLAMLKKIGIKADFIFGEKNQEQRQKALDDLKSGKLGVLIGSTILEVGVDVPSIGLVILAGGGKAEVGTRQSIGRGLRGKKGWNECFVVDFEDTGNKILASHAQTRKAILTGTPGFAENILGKGQDFDYLRMEALRAA